MHVCIVLYAKQEGFDFLFLFLLFLSRFRLVEKYFSPQKNVLKKNNLPVRIAERKHGTNRFRTVLYRLHLRKFFKRRRGRLETPPKTETTENGEKKRRGDIFFHQSWETVVSVQLQDENVGDSDRFPLKKDSNYPSCCLSTWAEYFLCTPSWMYTGNNRVRIIIIFRGKCPSEERERH